MMKIEETKITKLMIPRDRGLDSISIYLENYEPGVGRITIVCYNEVWTAFWGAMGSSAESDCNVQKFFCSCDEHYLAKNLSRIEPRIYDVNQIQIDIERAGVTRNREDPWNDLEVMEKLYGSDPVDWACNVPTTANPKYEYLCRVIRAVQKGLREWAGEK